VDLLTKEEKMELVRRCWNNTEKFGSIVFPDRFYRPFSPAHKEVFKAIDDDSIRKLLILAHRNFGKTSIIQLATQAKAITTRKKRFLVPVSNTASYAVMQSENLKRELVHNPRISSLFGPMKSDSFSKESWVSATGSMVMPRGRGQQVRGITYGNYRPDFLLCDDFEDSESVMNEDLRKKYKEWFYADLLGCVDRGLDNYRCIVIGTMLHEDSLLANLMEDPSWTVIKAPLCDHNFKSNWPEYMTDAQVVELADEYRDQGQIDVFYREYMCEVIATDEAAIQKDMFKYYDEEYEAMHHWKDLDTVVLIDPAKTVNPKADDSAIVGASFSAGKQHIYVRDIMAGKMFPNEIYDHALAMCSRLGCKTIGVEVTSLNEFVTYPLKNEISRRGSGVEVVELRARDKKEHRVRALIPFYRKGLVYHNKMVTRDLEAQLLSFPRSKRWDIMDALAYVVPMLDSGERYMVDSNAGMYPGEDEWKDLGYDPHIADEDWMIA